MRALFTMGVILLTMSVECAWAITQRPESSFPSRRQPRQIEATTPAAQRTTPRDTIRIPDDLRKGQEQLPEWSEDKELDEFLDDTLVPQP